MPPGGALFLYSDALTESRDAASECLGQSAIPAPVRTATVTAPTRPLDHLLAHVFATVPRPLRDDLTAVWMARDGGGWRGMEGKITMKGTGASLESWFAAEMPHIGPTAAIMTF